MICNYFINICTVICSLLWFIFVEIHPYIIGSYFFILSAFLGESRKGMDGYVDLMCLCGVYDIWLNVTPSISPLCCKGCVHIWAGLASRLCVTCGWG